MAGDLIRTLKLAALLAALYGAAAAVCHWAG